MRVHLILHRVLTAYCISLPIIFVIGMRLLGFSWEHKREEKEKAVIF